MMSKICPSCGYHEPDPQALYCNKCGYPFPRQQPQRSAAPAPAAARPAPRPAKRPGKKRTGGGFFTFGTLITEKHLKLIYILGAALIVLMSVMGIAGMFAKEGADSGDAGDEEKANATLIDTRAIAEYPAGSQVFWIIFLVSGSILWRMFCELFALLQRGHGGHTEEEEEEEFTDEIPEDYAVTRAAAPYGSAATGQMVECPKCHKVVAIEDLRECEHCGIQGCTNCIRMMGLLKKTLTCRECFEN